VHAEWTRKLGSAINAIWTNKQPDLAFLLEIFAGPADDSAKRMIQSLVDEAAKSKGAARALVLAMLWPGLEHAAWKSVVPRFASELGADANQLAKHGAVLLTLPSAIPLTIDEALALRETYGDARPLRAPVDVPSGLTLPPDLRELYARCDGFADIVPVADLASLQTMFADEVQRAIEDAEEPLAETEEELDIRSFLPTTALLAIGKVPGGDRLFLDPRRTGVFQYVHDESCVVRLEAVSIGALVARRIFGTWARYAHELFAFHQLKRQSLQHR
jgi:hypothetical protein